MENVEGYTVVYRWAEDVILAEVPVIPGCFSDGPTVEAARARVRDAILNFTDELRECGELSRASRLRHRRSASR